MEGMNSEGNLTGKSHESEVHIRSDDLLVLGRNEGEGLFIPPRSLPVFTIFNC